MISRFTENDISDKTPSELINLIKETSGGNGTLFIILDKVNLKTLVGTLEKKEQVL